MSFLRAPSAAAPRQPNGDDDGDDDTDIMPSALLAVAAAVWASLAAMCVAKPLTSTYGSSIYHVSAPVASSHQVGELGGRLARAGAGRRMGCLSRTTRPLGRGDASKAKRDASERPRTSG